MKLTGRTMSSWKRRTSWNSPYRLTRQLTWRLVSTGVQAHYILHTVVHGTIAIDVAIVSPVPGLYNTKLFAEYFNGSQLWVVDSHLLIWIWSRHQNEVRVWRPTIDLGITVLPGGRSGVIWTGVDMADCILNVLSIAVNVRQKCLLILFRNVINLIERKRALLRDRGNLI